MSPWAVPELEKTTVVPPVVVVAIFASVPLWVVSDRADQVHSSIANLGPSKISPPSRACARWLCSLLSGRTSSVGYDNMTNSINQEFTVTLVKRGDKACCIALSARPQSWLRLFVRIRIITVLCCFGMAIAVGASSRCPKKMVDWGSPRLGEQDFMRHNGARAVYEWLTPIVLRYIHVEQAQEFTQRRTPCLEAEPQPGANYPERMRQGSAGLEGSRGRDRSKDQPA